MCSVSAYFVSTRSIDGHDPRGGQLRRFRHEHEALRADPNAPEGDPFAIQLDRAARALSVDRSALERDVRLVRCEDGRLELA